MDSTMQDFPLTIAGIMRYACDVHGDRTVTTATGDGYRHDELSRSRGAGGQVGECVAPHRYHR